MRLALRHASQSCLPYVSYEITQNAPNGPDRDSIVVHIHYHYHYTSLGKKVVRVN